MQRPPAGRDRWITETFGFKAFALAVTAGLASALWLSLLLATIGAVGTLTAPTTVAARVISCPSGLLEPPCTVEFTSSAGQRSHRELERANLVGLSQGQQVSLALDADGTVNVAGWRPWLDVAILAGLAVSITLWSIRHLAAVLQHGAPRDALPLRDLAPFPTPSPPQPQPRARSDRFPRRHRH
ncbi:hypothetical protein [Gephyromycinifex aptenodytis]|uniref:hypothetical protein n=1 Tax=Gephyromycinifex aptenodytis TaxID=2716227 RepID=UPI001446F0E3|nr:hypothetical protein [Gephyromycinifex aptenodytis]